VTRDVLSILVDENQADHGPYWCINCHFAGNRLGERSLFDVAVFMMYEPLR